MQAATSSFGALASALVAAGRADDAFCMACSTGNLDVAQWLCGLGGVNTRAKNNKAFRDACYCNQLPVAVWLHGLGAAGRWHEHPGCQDLFVAVCGLGYLALAQWLYGIGGVEAHVGGLAAFRAACRNGQLHVAQWLHGLGGVVHVHDDTEAHLFWACMGGHLHMAQWLHSLGAVIDPDVFLRLPLDVGKWAVTKWLVELGGMERQVRFESGSAFIQACMEDNLEAAQWLVSLGAVDVVPCARRGFPVAVRKGSVHLTRWLLELGGLDVHLDQDWAFRVACHHLHVALAQWVYSLGGVDVHARQDMALMGMVNVLGAHGEYGSEESVAPRFARWLVSLDTRDGAWPAQGLAALKRWSPTRDAWMRSVVRCHT